MLADADAFRAAADADAAAARCCMPMTYYAVAMMPLFIFADAEAAQRCAMRDAAFADAAIIDYKILKMLPCAARWRRRCAADALLRVDYCHDALFAPRALLLMLLRRCAMLMLFASAMFLLCADVMRA